MKKIIDAELIAMMEQGKSQKDCASHFGVSEAAISKKCKRLRSFAARPAILDKLTQKEQKYVLAIVEGKTQTQAAMDSFEVTSRESAKSIGHRLMKAPEIQEAITAIMEDEGMGRRYLVKKLKSHVDDPDPNVSMHAVGMGLKLHDVFPVQKRANINLNADIAPVDLNSYLNR